MIYNDQVLSIYRELAHIGPIKKARLDQDSANPSINIKYFEVGSLDQGEMIQLEVAWAGGEARKIIDARFQVFGCGYAIAMAELMCRSLVKIGGQAISGNVNTDLLWLEEAVDLPSTKVSTFLLFEALMTKIAAEFN